MNRNIPLITLILTFMLRIMVPLTNSLYFFGELTLDRDGLWKTLYILSLVGEVAAVALLAVGLNAAKVRRIGAYIALGLPSLHYLATLAAFILLPAAREFIGPVYMIVLTVAVAFTAAMGYLTLRSANSMEMAEREAIPASESDTPAEASL